MQGWTLPLIFAMAGVGLVVVAIVDGGLVIRDFTIPPLSKPIRAISGIVGVAFLGVALYGYIPQRGSLNGPTGTFEYPAPKADIPLRTELRGTVTPAVPNRGSYWIVMRDDSGEYYTQGKIAASQSGTWTHSLALGSSWQDRSASVLLAFARDEQAGEHLSRSMHEGLSKLPDNVVVLNTLELRVQQ